MSVTRSIAYWTVTVLLLSGILSGGTAELMMRPENVEGIIKLGYPPYVIMLLGFWKVAGSIVLILPGLPRLKEWAYAGIFFNMTGAAVSHAMSGSASFHLVVTVSFAVLTLLSWRLRPQNRTLGTW